MNSRCIGKLISVSQRGIIAEMYETLGNYVNTIDGVRFVGEVGSYVSIYDIGRTIIGEITGVEEKPALTNESMNKPNRIRQLYIHLIGEIVSDRFYFGVSRMPLVFSEVNIISEMDLSTMLEVSDDEEIVDPEKDATRAKLLPIGSSVIFPDYAVRVNIDKFFGFHFAVFGNTGAGKSNTIASILQRIFSKTNYSACGAKFIIIDSNSEYAEAFSEITTVNPEVIVKTLIATEDIGQDSRLEIPVWSLTADDWAILLHATEKTQLPILKRAIEIARGFFSSDNSNDDIKNHILASTVLGIINSSDTSPSKSDKIKGILTTFNTDVINLDVEITEKTTLRKAVTMNYGNFVDEEAVIKYIEKYIKDDIADSLSVSKPVTYTMQQFLDAVQFATLYEGSLSSQRIQEYTSTLITRLQSLNDSIQGKILTKTAFNTVDAFIEDLLGENQIVNIDISSLDDSSSEVVTKVLAKLLLDHLKRMEIKAMMPINFIIEEAHRFVRNENNYGVLGYNIFERIAKEGRKFGLLLGISSQRPSDLSKTVVSQCSNFIIHRIQNPDDLQYISKMVPYVDQGIIDRLTYLQTGHALVFGTAINLPTLTCFSQASPQPDSDNAKISDKWYVEKKA
jgi:DNA helicase HerA-like ATPase